MLGNNLKDAREELEMTQTELGNIFGVSDSTVRGWENAYDVMPLRKLIRFCNQFNYSVDYILGLTNRNKTYSDKIIIDEKIMGKKLKSLRKNLGISQQEIADKCWHTKLINEKGVLASFLKKAKEKKGYFLDFTK